ncbi:MAG: glycosyltransferase family 2 protein [Solirubrobacteraceae bacterium MAG38_C4-C5]|nr:glycosyltransferase family 2 protein [Candidatus Siliceabacter maunaloa]
MTIVVVASSVRPELERCFDSVVRLAGMEVETILVDNASTDDTVAWVRATHPQIEVVTLPRNLGVAARDHGLRRARAPYTMFLDSDAVLTPGALPSMVDALDANPSWGLVGPRLVYADGRLQLSTRRFPPRLLPLLRRPPLSRYFENCRTVRRHLMADDPHDRIRPVLYVLGACQLFRTSLARVAGPFDDRVFLGLDDADWCIRIRDVGGEIVYLPEATVVHDYRRLTARHPLSRAAWRHLRAFAYFQRTYHSRRGELLALEEELDRCNANR